VLRLVVVVSVVEQAEVGVRRFCWWLEVVGENVF
jgi:hypothetical protein